MTVDVPAEKQTKLQMFEEKLKLLNAKADNLRAELSYTFDVAKVAQLQAEFKAATTEITKLKGAVRSEKNKMRKAVGKDEDSEMR